MANDVDSALQDLTGKPQALRAFQSQLAAATERRDFDAVEALVKKRTQGGSPEFVARMWLAAAERWASADTAVRGRAFGAAADAAWERVELFDFLERTFRMAGDVEGTEAILRTRAARSTDEDVQTQAWSAVGRHMAQNDRPDDALDAYVSMSRVRPSSAATALEEMAPMAALVAPSRWHAAEEAIARATGDGRTMLRVLDAKFHRVVTTEPSLVVNAAGDAARAALSAHAGLDTALGYVSAAWEAVPDERRDIYLLATQLAGSTPPARIAAYVAQLADETDQSAQAAAWWTIAAQADGPPDVAAHYWVHAGDRLAPADPAAALSAYTQGATVDPNTTTLVRERLAGLAAANEGPVRAQIQAAESALLASGGDWLGASEVLNQRIDAATGDDAATLLIELATLQHDELGRPDLAAMSFGRALASAESTAHVDNAAEGLEALLHVDASATIAAAPLKTHYQATNDIDGLQRVLRVLSEQASDPAVRGQAYRELGEIAVASDQDDDAILAFQNARALGALPDTSALRELLRKTERFEEALELLSAAIEAATSENRSALEVERAQTLYSAGAHAQAMAYAHVARGVVDDPSDVNAIFDALCQASGSATAAQRASDRLANHNPASAADLLWRVARALGLTTDEGLALALRASDTAAPSPAQTSQLQAAVERSGDAANHVAMQRAFLKYAADASAALSARRTLAQLLVSTEPTEARDLAYGALDANAADAEMHAVVLAVARAGAEPPAIAQALEDQLEHLTLDVDAAVAHLWELSTIYADDLGRQDLGFQAARRLLKLEPNHAAAAERVRQYTESVDDPRLRFETLAETLDELSNGETKANRHLELAEIALSLNAADTTATHLLAAAQLDALHRDDRREAAQQALSLRLDTDDPTGAIEAFATLAPLLDDERRGAQSEAVIDRLSGMPAMALQAADTALAGWEHPSPGVLDKHAQLARRANRLEDAIASLEQWFAEPDAEVPLDRRAIAATMKLEVDPANDAGWNDAAATLAADPDQMDVVLKLEDLRDEHARMAWLAETLADGAVGQAPEQRVKSLYRAADLVASEDDVLSEPYWRQILQIAPGETKALESLRGALRDRGDNRGEIQVLEDLLTNADDEAKAGVLREIAQLAEGDEAVEAAHLQVLEADISDIPSRLVLADLYERTERFDKAVECLEEAAALTADTVDAKALYLRAASITTEHLDDLERCERQLEAIVENNPADIVTLDRLATSYRGREAWNQLAKTLRRRVGVTTDADDKTRVLSDLASVEEVNREDREAAIDALEQLIEIEPKNLTALQDVARLHEERGAWDEFVRALDRLAQAAPIPALRDEILLRAAPALLRHLDRAADAQNVLQQAFVNNQPSASQLDLLREAAATSEDWLPFAATLKTIAEREEEVSQRIPLEVEVAETLADKVGDPLTAITYLQGLFSQAPVMGQHLTALEDIAARHELRKQLVDSYRQLATVNEGNDEVTWHALSQSADIAETVIEHPKVAFDIMGRASETPALRERADAEMRRLAEAHDMWDAYRSFLTDETDEAEGDDAIALLVRRAEVERDQLNDWQAAFETLMGGFQDAPFDERIRTPLFALADEHNAWEFITKLLELVQANATGAEKTKFIVEIANVYGDRLGRPADAFTQQLRAWQQDPLDDKLRTGLEHRAEAADKRVDLLAAYEWHTKQGLSGDTLVEALRRAAVLAAELDLAERAIALFCQLVAAVDAKETVAVVDEADALFTLAGERTRTIEFALAIPDAGAGDGLANAMLRGSQVADEMGDAESRLSCLRGAVRIATHPAAIRPALIDALRESDDAPALATALETRLTEVDDDAERAALTEELMTVYRQRIGDEQRALVMARRLMDLRPDDGGATDAYVDQLTASERWPDLIDHYLQRAEATDDADAARSARLEAARVAEEYLDDPRRALRIADTIVADAPDDAAALELRARALAGLSRWTEHIEALEALAEVRTGTGASAVYAQAAAVLEHQLVYSDRALQMWKRAANADPTSGRAASEMARLTGELSAPEDALPLWEQAVSLYETDGTAAELSNALTALAVTIRAAGVPTDIVPILSRAVEADPRNGTARAEYEIALAETGDVDTILRLLDAEFEGAGTDAERALIQMRRAQVLFFDGDKEADALKALDRAEALAPNRGVYCLRGDIHLINGHWDDAANAYQTALGDAETVDPHTTLEPRPMMAGEDIARTTLSIVYLTRAGYAQEAAGRITPAQDYYTSAHLEDDSYGPAIVGLARLALRRGTPEGAAIYFSAYHATAPHDPELDAQLEQLKRDAGLA